MHKYFALLCAISSVSSAALADDLSSCNVIINNGLKEYNISNDSSAYLNTVFNQYCYADGRTNSSAFNAGLNAVVQAIPVALTLGSTDTSQATTNFCKNYKSSTYATQTTNTYNETIVRRAYDSYDACLQAAALGFFITHDILTPDKAQLLLRAGVGKPIEVDGIDTTPNVSCSGPDQFGKQIHYSIATKNMSNVAIGIFCTRKSRQDTSGVTVYDDGSVAIALAGTKYNFYWPKTSLLPENVASQVQSSVLELRTRLGGIDGQISSLTSGSVGPDVYQCPGTNQHGQGSAGGGAWGSYGCEGQITTQSTCVVIEYPHTDNVPCQRIGKLRLAP